MSVYIEILHCSDTGSVVYRDDTDVISMEYAECIQYIHDHHIDAATVSSMAYYTARTEWDIAGRDTVYQTRIGHPLAGAPADDITQRIIDAIWYEAMPPQQPE